jgi:SAM-dependent methyltransferase
LCGSAESSLVQTGLRFEPSGEVRRCAECGLVYQWPQPSAEELDRYYAEAYRSDYEEPPLPDRQRGDMPDALARIERLRPLLGEAVTLLEVGTGSGAFIESVVPYVGRVTGFELEDEARSWLRSRGLAPRIVAGLEELEAEDARFDLVVLFHVLEHVTDPVASLVRLRRLVAPGGRIVLEVPSVDDALVSLYDVPSYGPFYFQKAHLWYFSRSSLTGVLARAGLAAQISGVQRYDLSNHLRWLETGEPGGMHYYDDVLAPAAREAYAESLVAAGRADTLWAVASSD